jgi:hypothetical protein
MRNKNFPKFHIYSSRKNKVERKTGSEYLLAQYPKPREDLPKKEFENLSKKLRIEEYR